MSVNNERNTVNYYISGGTGGEGGPGGANGGSGGSGGGPVFTNNINTVANFTNKITMHGHGLVEVLGEWLEFPPDTKDRQCELRSLHHKATGQWLFRDDRFMKWKGTPGSLWITGISGTGKSVLSSTVIENIVMTCPKRSAVSYFYFDFRNERRRRMDIMLRSIIWQLSGQSNPRYSALHSLYKKLREGAIQPQQAHLQGVLAELLVELDRTYIVIDGLDECDKADWHRLIRLIQSLHLPPKNAPHLLFTSQPLEEFRKAFDDGAFIELGFQGSIDDIESFVSSEVSEVGNWASNEDHSTRVTGQIVRKSNGMIRMAACLLIELQNCFWEDSWVETLRTLPADLFGIYTRFLNRAKLMVFIQAIFRWLLFSARALESKELADAIAFRLSDHDFDFSDLAKSIYDPKRRSGNSNSFKVLAGLVLITKDSSAKPYIALAHSSVRDYLLSPQFQREFGAVLDLGKELSHKFIALNCVRYLRLFAETDHPMTEDTVTDYPMSWYAAKYCSLISDTAVSRTRSCCVPCQCVSSPMEADHLHRGWSRPISPPLSLCFEIRYTEGMEFLLNTYPPVMDEADEDGNTTLHLAARVGHLLVVQQLIDRNASIYQANDDGYTPLHCAVKKGHLGVARLLIEHHSSVSRATTEVLIKGNGFIDQANQDGQTVLHLASDQGQLDIVQLLIENRGSVDLADRYGWTALNFASGHGHLDAMRALIEHGAPVDQATKYGWTALHFASVNGKIEAVQLLIDSGASIDQANHNVWTALHLAVSRVHQRWEDCAARRTLATTELCSCYSSVSRYWPE